MRTLKALKGTVLEQVLDLYIFSPNDLQIKFKSLEVDLCDWPALTAPPTAPWRSVIIIWHPWTPSVIPVEFRCGKSFIHCSMTKKTTSLFFKVMLETRSLRFLRGSTKGTSIRWALKFLWLAGVQRLEGLGWRIVWLSGLEDCPAFI